MTILVGFKGEFKMANVGGIDRVLRFVAGAVLAIIGIKPDLVGMASTGALHWVLLAVGIVMIATAALRFCPLYPLLGLNTCPLKK